jgi:hypothetical protein
MRTRLTIDGQKDSLTSSCRDLLCGETAHCLWLADDDESMEISAAALAGRRVVRPWWYSSGLGRTG